MPNTRTSWNKSNYRTGTKRTTYRSGGSSWGTTKSTGGMNTRAYSPTQFNTQRKTVIAKIGSFRNLSQQLSGIGRVTAFSPSVANNWIKFVNNGNLVYKFTPQQFTSSFGAQWNQTTPNSVFKHLKSKYGAGIRAVARGRGNTWLICASPNVTGRPFSTYNWK